MAQLTTAKPSVRNPFKKQLTSAQQTGEVQCMSPRDVISLVRLFLKNVFISNCYIETGDDAICLKTEDSDSGKNCENIVVTNCIIISDDTAIKLGTSSKAEIKQCTFSNIIIRNSRFGIAFYMKDGGNYKDIQFSNINIETVISDSTNSNNYPIFMDIEPRHKSSPLGTISNIVFSNILINTYAGSCLIQGRSDKSIENISLNNVRMNVLSRSDMSGRNKPRGYNPKEKAQNDFANISSNFTFANIRNLNIDNLIITDTVGSDKFQRNAIWGENLENVVVKGLSFEPAIPNTNLSSISFSQCKDVYVSECRSKSTKTPFFEIAGDKSANINLSNNYLQSFSKPTMMHKEVSEKLNIKQP
jgi:polygalacturonase